MAIALTAACCGVRSMVRCACSLARSIDARPQERRPPSRPWPGEPLIFFSRPIPSGVMHAPQCGERELFVLVPPRPCEFLALCKGAPSSPRPVSREDNGRYLRMPAAFSGDHQVWRCHDRSHNSAKTIRSNFFPATTKSAHVLCIRTIPCMSLFCTRPMHTMLTRSACTSRGVGCHTVGAL